MGDSLICGVRDSLICRVRDLLLCRVCVFLVDMYVFAHQRKPGVCRYIRALRNWVIFTGLMDIYMADVDSMTH